MISLKTILKNFLMAFKKRSFGITLLCVLGLFYFSYVYSDFFSFKSFKIYMDSADKENLEMIFFIMLIVFCFTIYGLLKFITLIFRYEDKKIFYMIKNVSYISQIIVLLFGVAYANSIIKEIEFKDATEKYNEKKVELEKIKHEIKSEETERNRLANYNAALSANNMFLHDINTKLKSDSSKLEITMEQINSELGKIYVDAYMAQLRQKIDRIAGYRFFTILEKMPMPQNFTNLFDEMTDQKYNLDFNDCYELLKFAVLMTKKENKILPIKIINKISNEVLQYARKSKKILSNGGLIGRAEDLCALCLTIENAIKYNNFIELDSYIPVMIKAIAAYKKTVNAFVDEIEIYISPTSCDN